MSDDWILLNTKRPHIGARVQCVVEEIPGQPHVEFLYLQEFDKQLYWDSNPNGSRDHGIVYAFEEVSYWKHIDHIPHKPLLGIR
jgi:hypothetical protein